MDLTPFFLVLFVVYSLKVLLLNGQSCRDEERSQRGFALLNSTYSSHSTDRYPHCLNLCVGDRRCMSLNFWWYKSKCDLNNKSRESCPTCYVKEATTTYQGMQRNPAPEESLQNLKPESCSALKKQDPSLNSGSYVIDPDGEGGVPEFTVTCDMTYKNGVGVTIISHDSKDRTLVDGCDTFGCYERNIVYTGASLSQLASLTTVSSHCEQFIRYECYSSVLFSWPQSWWVSRDSKKMTYWAGGGPPDSKKCGCGLTNSCADPRYGCNCDMNDNVWREDSGLLTNKSHLPVSQLRFGDTEGPSEQGYHTLGKFKCYGTGSN